MLKRLKRLKTTPRGAVGRHDSWNNPRPRKKPILQGNSLSGPLSLLSLKGLLSSLSLLSLLGLLGLLSLSGLVSLLSHVGLLSLSSLYHPPPRTTDFGTNPDPSRAITIRDIPTLCK